MWTQVIAVKQAALRQHRAPVPEVYSGSVAELATWIEGPSRVQVMKIDTPVNYQMQDKMYSVRVLEDLDVEYSNRIAAKLSPPEDKREMLYSE